MWGLLAALLVRTASGDPGYFVAQVTDITRQKAAEQTLARHAAELECSNSELEEFAALASHDLQKPLRTVSGYSELLTERYHGELDEVGNRWITYHCRRRRADAFVSSTICCRSHAFGPPEATSARPP